MNLTSWDQLVNRQSDVRRAASGGSANLWKAVKLAKNLVNNELPSDLTLGGAPVACGDVANSFARHFSEKIKLNVSKTSVNLNIVYNGKCKLIVQNRNFMQKSDVKKRLYDLSNKNHSTSKLWTVWLTQIFKKNFKYLNI